VKGTGALLVACLLLAGCQDDARSPVVSAQPAPTPYGGALAVTISDSETAPLLERVGAAGKALECDSPVYVGERGYFGPNLEAVRKDAVAVIEEFMRRTVAGPMPTSGYALERAADERVLFSYDVEDRTKVAFVAVDHKKDSVGREGWAMEAWAMCDPSELPEEVADDLGYGVWEDRSGHRVPLSTAHSFNGGEHCDWEDITFLRHGGNDYVRDPAGKLRDYLVTTFGKDVPLPPSARDTGLRRGGLALWTVPGGDAAYVVGEGGSVERWPAAKQAIGCA
jgi:hypothetical protein